jgi:hypothetical protein
MIRIVLLLVNIIFAYSASAQITMSSALKAMPDSLLVYLTENNRLDCIDFCEAGMKAEVRNALDGKSEMKVLTDHYALIQLSEACQVELCLLDGVGEQTICMVSTYGTQLKESSISFFTSSWLPLSTCEHITLPDWMFTAKLDENERTICLTRQTAIDRPALEGQTEYEILQRNLKWDSQKFK